MKHNNVIPNAHFRKHWQDRVKTWFNQPARKERRRLNRQKKAVKVAPRPVSGLFRPAVTGQTVKYNTKLREGRGFSLAELKAAKINKKVARTIGIAVDHRRRSISEEALKRNVERLAAYKNKLVVFPQVKGKPKQGDSPAAELAQATQVKGEIMPIVKQWPKLVARKITEEEKKADVVTKLRINRANKKYVGVRAKRQKEKEAAAELAKKK